MEMLSALDDPQYREINGPGKAINLRLKRNIFLAAAQFWSVAVYSSLLENPVPLNFPQR